jgi:hypothetical protein
MLLGQRRRRLRIVNFLRVFAGPQLVLDVYAGAHVLGSHHRFKSMDQGLRQLLIRTEGSSARAVAVMHQRRIAVGVDHRHVFRTQPVDRARHQLRNRLLRLLGEPPAARLQNHRRLGFVLPLGK